MIKRALVIVVTIIGSLAGSAGVALADDTGLDNNNHIVCVVFAPNQKYTNASYVCVSTPNLPPT
jgi:hypothetical protein